MNETEKFSVPETSDDFELFVKDQLSDQLQSVDEREVDQQKLHWRGLDPTEALALLTGSQEAISLRSNMPNTTIEWKRAISYGRGQTKYQLAVGMMPEDDWQIQPAMSHVPEDLKKFPEAMAYQKGNFIVNGDVRSNDVRYVIIRPHGDKPGEVGRPKYYRVESPKKAA